MVANDVDGRGRTMQRYGLMACQEGERHVMILSDGVPAARCCGCRRGYDRSDGRTTRETWLLAPLQALCSVAVSASRGRAHGIREGRSPQRLAGSDNSPSRRAVQIAHYEDFFHWRAEHLRGYKPFMSNSPQP
jgi:hypothetical protein